MKLTAKELFHLLEEIKRPLIKGIKIQFEVQPDDLIQHFLCLLEFDKVDNVRIVDLAMQRKICES